MGTMDMESPAIPAEQSTKTVALGVVSDKQAHTLYAAVGAFFALAVFAIVCRALALYIKRTWGSWDDWTMIFSIAPLACLTALTCLQAEKGTPIHRGEHVHDWLKGFMFDTFLLAIFSLTSLYVVKLSLCIRYLRIADNADDWFWRLSMATIVLLTAHWISNVVVWACQCFPIATYWNPEIPGKCINNKAWTLSIAGVNLTTDFIVLVIPLRPIWRLRMPTKQRFAILGIFTLGGISTIAGALRFYYLYNLYDDSGRLGRTVVGVGIAGYAEISLAIFCGCAPSFKALYASLRAKRQPLCTERTETSNGYTMDSTGTSHGYSDPMKEISRSSPGDLERGPPDAG